jgi:hypothetical protein
VLIGARFRNAVAPHHRCRATAFWTARGFVCAQVTMASRDSGASNGTPIVAEDGSRPDSPTPLAQARTWAGVTRSGEPTERRNGLYIRLCRNPHHRVVVYGARPPLSSPAV